MVAGFLSILLAFWTIGSVSSFEHRCHSLQKSWNALRMADQEPWVYDTSPKSAREKIAFKNNVPFGPEVYETIKSTIELLSRRMKKRQVSLEMSVDEAREASGGLTLEESKWLSDAVETLIEDAYKYGPPLRIPNIAPPPEGEAPPPEGEEEIQN